MRPLVRRIAAGVLWLLLVIAIALGAAGLVSGTDHLPGTPARPELTYGRDREVEAILDLVTADLVELADTVSALGVQARGALAALNGSETETVEAAIAEGDRLLDAVRDRTTSLRLQLADVPYVARTDTAMLVSNEPVARHASRAGGADRAQGGMGTRHARDAAAICPMRNVADTESYCARLVIVSPARLHELPRSRSIWRPCVICTTTGSAA
jgi:hypothetical protein